MILRPPRSTRTDTSFPTRRSSDLPPFAVRYVVISELAKGGGAEDFATALVDEVAAEGPVPVLAAQGRVELDDGDEPTPEEAERSTFIGPIDRKSTRLNSSH